MNDDGDDGEAVEEWVYGVREGLGNGGWEGRDIRFTTSRERARETWVAVRAGE